MLHSDSHSADLLWMNLTNPNSQECHSAPQCLNKLLDTSGNPVGTDMEGATHFTVHSDFTCVVFKATEVKFKDKSCVSGNFNAVCETECTPGEGKANNPFNFH